MISVEIKPVCGGFEAIAEKSNVCDAFMIPEGTKGAVLETQPACFPIYNPLERD